MTLQIGNPRMPSLLSPMGIPGTERAVSSSRRTGMPDLCIAHGEGNWCEWTCCFPFSSLPTSRSLARFYHPKTKQGICTAVARHMVTDAMVSGDKNSAKKLKKHFGFKKDHSGSQPASWTSPRLEVTTSAKCCPSSCDGHPW